MVIKMLMFGRFLSSNREAGDTSERITVRSSRELRNLKYARVIFQWREGGQTA